VIGVYIQCVHLSVIIFQIIRGHGIESSTDNVNWPETSTDC